MKKQTTNKGRSKVPQRNPEWTVVSVNCPKAYKVAAQDAATQLDRPSTQVWRMAFAYANSVGWDKIPTVP